MDRTYILHQAYTSGNIANLEGINLLKMYPQAAGTKQAVEKELNRRIESAKSEGLAVEEITLEDVEYHFDRVVKVEADLSGTVIYGISSVWTL